MEVRANELQANLSVIPLEKFIEKDKLLIVPYNLRVIACAIRGNLLI